jgi:hypothetical protein
MYIILSIMRSIYQYSKYYSPVLISHLVGSGRCLLDDAMTPRLAIVTQNQIVEERQSMEMHLRVLEELFSETETRWSQSGIERSTEHSLQETDLLH